jgi:O-antigen/teichoic acid export membrane protein
MNLRATFQAVSDFRAFNITAISRLVWTTVFLFGLILFHAISISNVIFVNILAELLTLLLISYFLRCHTTLFDNPLRAHPTYLKDNLRYGFKVYISSVFTFFNYKQDRFLLNAYLSPASVGVYNVGANLGEKLWLLSQSVSTVLFPKIASLEDDEHQRRWMTPFIARHVFTGTAIAAFLLFWLTPFLIQLLYGEEFSDASGVLRIILPGVVFLTISRIVSNDIAGRGHPGVNTILSGISVLINLIANILLIPPLGILGAAWASTISYTFNAIIRVGVYCAIANVAWRDVFFLKPADFQVWRRLVKSKY